MPPRSKKRKTTHHQFSSNATHADPSLLSHEEIWDDSALLRSWNDALAEYNFYHSIYARGEDVDEVLRRAEEDERQGEVEAETDMEAGELDVNSNDSSGPIKNAVQTHSNGVENVVEPKFSIPDDHAEAARRQRQLAQLGDLDDGAEDGEVDGDKDGLGETEPTAMADLEAASKSYLVPASTGTQSDAERAHTTSTQTLENIKMAYYWAGYYSGIYDAQRPTGA